MFDSEDDVKKGAGSTSLLLVWLSAAAAIEAADIAAEDCLFTVSLGRGNTFPRWGSFPKVARLGLTKHKLIVHFLTIPRSSLVHSLKIEHASIHFFFLSRMNPWINAKYVPEEQRAVSSLVVLSGKRHRTFNRRMTDAW
jgi:hypothetical protein